MPNALPATVNVVAAVGSIWSYTYTITNADGVTPANLTGKTFEFAIRRSVYDTGTPLVSVNTASSTSLGTITVNTTTAAVQVMLTPAATLILKNGGGPYALWMDPNLSDATTVVVGQFYCNPVTNP